METNVANKFSIYDYAAFVGMLAVSAVIGIYYAIVDRSKNTTNNFLMGGRSMGVFPVAFSLLASFLSAIAILGTPVEMYNYGTQYWTHIIMYPVIVYITATCFIPVFYELGTTSCYEYMERRFNKSLRIICSILFSFQTLVYMAIVLYAPSLALAQVTGIGVWHSVLSIGIVCTFYTSIGGMKAVIWTDVFQFSVMLVSIFTVIIKGVYDNGGISAVMEINSKFDRFEFFDFRIDPMIRHTFWILMIGTFFIWGPIYCCNQSMVQRYLSTPTMKQSKRTVWLVLPFWALFISVLCATGLVLFSNYANCDPIATKRISASDQLVPLFVMETLGTFKGIPGIFVAGVFSGSLSTVSSGMNSLAAVTLEDYLRSLFNLQLSEDKATLITRILAVIYGVITIALVAVAAQMGSVLSAALGIFGLLGAPVFGLFIVGIFLPYISSKGAMTGLISGLVVGLWTGVGAIIEKPYIPLKPFPVTNCSFYNETMNSYTDDMIHENILIAESKSESIPAIYHLSYMYFGFIAGGTTILVSILVSLIFKNEKEIDSSLFAPLVRRIVDKKSFKPSKNGEIIPLDNKSQRV